MTIVRFNYDGIDCRSVMQELVRIISRDFRDILVEAEALGPKYSRISLRPQS